MKALRIKAVEYLGEYRLTLTFSDGTRTAMDFREKIVGRGGVFTPLEDKAVFKQVVVDPVAGTIVFPGDIDFCPDTLHKEAMAAGNNS